VRRFPAADGNIPRPAPSWAGLGAHSYELLAQFFSSWVDHLSPLRAG